MTQYFSKKIKKLSFICIILVLYIHSDFHDYPNEIHGMVFNFKLQEFISGMIGRCAVPLFFAISGYLFFVGLNHDNYVDYPKLWIKMRKRVRTLFVPYLIGCLFPVVFYLVLEYIPGCQRFINGDNSISDIFNLPIHRLICFIYFDSGSGTPFAFHLWFLRDLIFIVALSPVLLTVSKWLGKNIICIILFVMSFCDIPLLPIYGMFWFMFGTCCLDRLSSINNRFIPITFLILCILEMVYPFEYWKYVEIPIIMLGVTAIWIIYDMLCKSVFKFDAPPFYLQSCEYTFFIYLFHEPTLNIVRKLLIIPLGRSSAGFAANYLIAPWIFAVLFVCVGILLRKYFPRVYSVCVGGR